MEIRRDCNQNEKCFIKSSVIEYVLNINGCLIIGKDSAKFYVRNEKLHLSRKEDDLRTICSTLSYGGATKTNAVVETYQPKT